MSDNKRKILLINKRFQLSILVWFVSLSLGVLAIIFFANSYFFYHFTKEALSAGIPENHTFFKFLNDQKEMMNYLFLAIMFAVAIILTLTGLIVSHRIAGPLYRLTEHLKKNSVDNCPPLKFREGDYFPEIEKAFNDFIKRH